MKGLTAKAKAEVSLLQESECCNTALLSALIHSAGSISFSREGVGVYLTSESEDIIELAYQLVEELYGEKGKKGKSELELRGDFVLEMLFDLGILTYYGDEIGAMAGINGFVVTNECCAKSYLKGLFLGCGSVSVNKKYHLEMAFSTSEMADDVCALLSSFDITARDTFRKDKHVVYIKSSEAISDFLALIGANKAVLELNNTAALRYVNMYTNRRINCDMANADKVVETSMKQIEAIEKIIDTITDAKLLATAKARIENPDSSYEDLAEILGVSKGCIKYRLNKLVALANEN
ncbi:MAG: DNA-binding protein WhiA [Clostridiales bacterium]|nr:DNA-binding protein WhiA [Clostridiales bacterium]